MNREPIYGVVRDKQKSIYYTGLETPTATVLVDNDRREIAVNVNVVNILGTTPNTAFPGDYGALLAQNLDAEIARSTETDTQHEESLVQLNKNNEQLAEHIQQVQMSIPTVVEDLKNAASYAKVDYVDKTFVTETWVKNEIAKAQLDGEEVDLSLYVMHEQLSEILNPYVTTEAADQVLANYVTKEEQEEVLSKYVVSDVLNDYVTQTSLNSTLQSYPTREDVADILREADLDNYYTRDETDDLFKDYYTSTEVDAKLSDIDVSSQLKNYYTKEETSSAIQSALSDIEFVVCGSAADMLKQITESST